MAIGEAESTDQPNALILGAGEAVTDDDGSPDGAVEDLRHAGEPARRFGKLDGSHRFDSNIQMENQSLEL